MERDDYILALAAVDSVIALFTWFGIRPKHFRPPEGGGALKSKYVWIGIFLFVSSFGFTAYVYFNRSAAELTNAERIAFPNPLPKPEEVYGRTFFNESVVIDNKNFDHCHFKDVRLVYHGLGPWSMKEITWEGKVFIQTDNKAASSFHDLFFFVQKTTSGMVGTFSLDDKGNATPIPEPIFNKHPKQP